MKAALGTIVLFLILAFLLSWKLYALAIATPMCKPDTLVCRAGEIGADGQIR